MALFTWTTPAACSWEPADTSCTRSAVFLMAGTSSARRWPDRSATLTLDPASPPISLAAFWLRSASFLCLPQVAATGERGRQPAEDAQVLVDHPWALARVIDLGVP